MFEVGTTKLGWSSKVKKYFPTGQHSICYILWATITRDNTHSSHDIASHQDSGTAIQGCSPGDAEQLRAPWAIRHLCSLNKAFQYHIQSVLKKTSIRHAVEEKEVLYCLKASAKQITNIFFEQDVAPTHNALKTQWWRQSYFPAFWEKGICLCNSTDQCWK